MGRGLAVVVVVLAVVAPSAHAGGRLIAVGPTLAGAPALAGDALLWPQRSGDRHSVELMAADGTRSRQLVIAQPHARMGLAADPARVALALSGRSGTSADPALFTGAPGATLEAFETCPRGGRCTPCTSDRPRVAVSGNVVAYDDPCRSEHVVRDVTEAGERRYRVLDHWAVAGDFIAYEDGHGAQHPPTYVRNWRTGAEVLRIDDHVDGLALRDDGLVVAAVDDPDAPPGPRDLAWSSPADPVLHRFATIDYAQPVAIAGERVAFRARDERGRESVGAVGLDGSGLVSTPTHDTVLGVAFDGQRLVWDNRPCLNGAIVEWDLGTAPPSLPLHACPVARPRSAAVRIDGRGHAVVPLRCPEDPLGCRGTAWVSQDHEDYYAWHLTRAARFRIQPGESVELRLPLRGRRICRAARPRARIRLTVPGRRNAGYPGFAQRRVRMRGRDGFCGRR
jgi:hypothetical protein